MKDNPIRILQVIRHMNVGGAETLIMNLYRNMDREKIQFDFLVFGPGVFDKEILKMGGKIHCLQYITDIGQVKFKKQLKDFFNDNKYEIIHSHIDQVSGIILEVANECGIKVRISHSHNTKNSNGFIGKLYKIYLQSKICNNANVLLACGDEAAKWLYKKKSKDAIIINNGIDIDKFKYSEEKRAKVRMELKLGNDEFIIGHIGRFSKVKNHAFLIDIFNEVLKMNSNSRLVLVGVGELQEKIKKMVEEKGIKDKVMFLGLRDDVDYLYSAFDCFVFPSLFEGLPVALIEAQTAGLPIVASNRISQKANIFGSIEFIDINNSPQIWAKKIIGINNERKDCSNIMIKAGYDIKNTANIYQKLCSSHLKKI